MWKCQQFLLIELLQMTYQNGKCLHCKSEMGRSLNFDLQGPILLVMFWIGFDCNPFSNPGFSWRIGLLPNFGLDFGLFLPLVSISLGVPVSSLPKRERTYTYNMRTKRGAIIDASTFTRCHISHSLPCQGRCSGKRTRARMWDSYSNSNERSRRLVG